MIETQRARDLDVRALTEQLLEPIAAAVQTPIGADQVSLLEAAKGVADDVAKLLVRDRAGRPRAVVLCASPVAPELVRRGIERARLARAALGDDLGSVILEPLGEGRIDGLSYAILPYCNPVRRGRLWGRWSRARLAGPLLDWWRRCARRTARPVAPEDVGDRFVRPLAEIAELEPLPADLRDDATRAIDRIERGVWSPHQQLMHGDLWLGNVLLRPAARSRRRRDRLVVIDWPGSLLDGYGLFDLLRLSTSLKLTPARLRHEVALHTEILGCGPDDARSHLLAALGHVALDLEHFPIDRFVAMSSATDRELTRCELG